MKKSKLGLIISLVGLFIMGISIGFSVSKGESNLGLTFTGLFIVFIGLFIKKSK